MTTGGFSISLLCIYIFLHCSSFYLVGIRRNWLNSHEVNIGFHKYVFTYMFFFLSNVYYFDMCLMLFVFIHDILQENAKITAKI